MSHKLVPQVLEGQYLTQSMSTQQFYSITVGGNKCPGFMKIIPIKPLGLESLRSWGSETCLAMCSVILRLLSVTHRSGARPPG